MHDNLIACGCGATVDGRQVANHKRGRKHREWVAAGATAADRREPPADAPRALPADRAEKLQVKGRMSGEEAPPSDYEAELAKTFRAPHEDLEARELTEAEQAARAEARAAGVAPADAEGSTDGRAGVVQTDLTPTPDAQANDNVWTAPPPWAEHAPPPPGFDRSGRASKPAGEGDDTTSTRPSDAAIHPGETIHNRLAVGVDATPEGRNRRSRYAREASEKQPTVLEQMLGANPRMTRDDWFFADWTARNPDGHRFTFTHFYGEQNVLEDRFDTPTPRDRAEIALKVAAIAAHNARYPERAPIGYLVLHGGRVRPDYDEVERAMAGEAVIDLDLPTITGFARLEPGRIVEASTPIFEQREDYRPGPQPLVRATDDVPVSRAPEEKTAAPA